jgi:hypothetical protein
MTFAVLAEYSEQGQLKAIVISSDWRGPPVTTAMSDQSYMWVGPPDLLSNLTHKCLKLALMLTSPFWDEMLFSLGGTQLLCIRGTSLGKKVAGTYQTARRQNSEDGDLNATFTHHRTPIVYMLWEDPKIYSTCNVPGQTAMWRHASDSSECQSKQKLVIFSFMDEHILNTLPIHSSAHLQFFYWRRGGTNLGQWVF